MNLLMLANDGTCVFRNDSKRGSVLQDNSGESHGIYEARVYHIMGDEVWTSCHDNEKWVLWLGILGVWR